MRSGFSTPGMEDADSWYFVSAVHKHTHCVSYARANPEVEEPERRHSSLKLALVATRAWALQWTVAAAVRVECSKLIRHRERRAPRCAALPSDPPGGGGGRWRR
jgi:hypothetical protein